MDIKKVLILEWSDLSEEFHDLLQLNRKYSWRLHKETMLPCETSYNIDLCKPEEAYETLREWYFEQKKFDTFKEWLTAEGLLFEQYLIYTLKDGLNVDMTGIEKIFIHVSW